MEQNRRLIDANALMRKICDAKCGREYEDCINEGDCDFDYFIFHAPTITDVEPVRHGRWVHDINNLYCPNCGVKMDMKV